MSNTGTIYFKSGYSAVNGIKMYYEIHGNGEPLVLIHGGGSTIGTTFGRIIPFLAKHYKLIAVELQAHGHTDDRDGPESFEQDADDVATLLKDLQIPKAAFFGFSNGGNTAMQIAMRHPAMVNKLILASTFYKRDGFFPGFFDMMQHASLENMPKSLQDAFLAITPDSKRLQAMHDKDRNRMIAFKDWTDDMMLSIKAPALIINADHDVIVNEHAVIMSKLIPGARLMILPGTHGSYIGEIGDPHPGKMPALTADVIIEFLQQK